jgi:hypothetical protein
VSVLWYKLVICIHHMTTIRPVALKSRVCTCSTWYLISVPFEMLEFDEWNCFRYANACLSNTKTLQKVLYKEFVSRLNEDEESARVTLNDGYTYYTKKIAGAEYRLHCMWTLVPFGSFSWSTHFRSLRS